MTASAIQNPAEVQELLQWLTVEEQEELDALLIGDPCNSLADYTRYTYPGHYDMQPHHRLIIEHLEAVERGDITRLMIFAPPQRGKSELVSVRFPAWCHGRNPDWGIMAFSHTASLAEDFSGQVRDQVAGEDWPFPGVQLKHGQAGVREWRLAGGRGRHFAAGVNGGGTGKGATLAIVDDPFKDDKDSGSALVRDRVYAWYWKVVITRMAGDGRVVLMHTRWHDDDLAGRLLRDMATGGDQWEVLELPEVAEEGAADPLGREPGEALWPGRFPLESTRVIRDTQAAVWFPLYQQRPQALSGGMFKRPWLAGRYDPTVLPEFQMVVQTVDSAFSEDTSADYSVIATWGATLTHLYLLDVWRERVAYPDLIAALRSNYAKWQRLSPWLWIENKASGQSAIQTLRRESSIPVMEYEPGNVSKRSRAQDATPWFGSGRVLLPEGATWLHDWINEHAAFPTGAHDDQVDTTSSAVKILVRAVGVEGQPEEEPAEEAA